MVESGDEVVDVGTRERALALLGFHHTRHEIIVKRRHALLDACEDGGFDFDDGEPDGLDERADFQPQTDAFAHHVGCGLALRARACGDGFSGRTVESQGEFLKHGHVRFRGLD